MVDMFGDMFEDIFGRGMWSWKQRKRIFADFMIRGYERQRMQKEEDLRGDMVTFEEAVFGCDKTFTFKDLNIRTSKSLQVHIPAD